MWYVYIIKSKSSDFIYIGSTNDLKRRIAEHNAGLSQSTKHHLPFELLSYIAVQAESQVRSLEKYFKTGSGKAILYKSILGKEANTSPDKTI